MYWGLVPSWWKKPLAELPSTFNARAETVAERPMFRGAFKYRRCGFRATMSGAKMCRRSMRYSATLLTRDPRDTSCCLRSWEDAALLICCPLFARVAKRCRRNWRA